MKEYKDTAINRVGFDHPAQKISGFDNLQLFKNMDGTLESKVIQLPGIETKSTNAESILLKGIKPKISETGNEPVVRKSPAPKLSSPLLEIQPGLFRLFVKNGEYAYARPNDIIMMESCDHMVKVYLAVNDKTKKTIRHNTLKDFLLQLPQDQFMRIGRFCAVNIQRLSGGNCNEQTFEFDFKISIKLKHAISNTAFNTIGK